MKINECARGLGEGGWGQKSAGVSLQMARTGRRLGEMERDGTVSNWSSQHEPGGASSL